MGLHDGIVLRWSTDTKPGETVKRVDSRFCPDTLGDREYLTATVEVAFPKTAKKLFDDAKCWLLAANGEVKSAITIQVHRKRPEIKMQRTI